MNNILTSISNFIVTPLFRWVFIIIAIVNTILQYLNEPQRFSYSKAPDGFSYKWHLYLLALFTCITTLLTVVGLNETIPFTHNLPEYWYMYFFVLYVAIITQITIDSKQYKDDGSFQPPPSYLFPQKYRVMFAYIGLCIDIVIMIQIFIYFGISDISKKTVMSRYITERFGGFYVGNKMDFLFEWSGLIHVVLKIYRLMLQKNFQACKFGLPPSWNA